MVQDIKITPSGAGDKIPQMLFVGSGATAPNMELNVLPDSRLSYESTDGEVFSISKGLQSGVIFAVKDISGIDHISVNASGDVKLNQFYGDTFVFNLPTADPSNSGQLWRDGTDLKVSDFGG